MLNSWKDINKLGTKQKYIAEKEDFDIFKMTLCDLNPWGRTSFDKMLAFIKKRLINERKN